MTKTIIILFLLTLQSAFASDFWATNIAALNSFELFDSGGTNKFTQTATTLSGSGYSIAWPAAQGAAGTCPTNDGSGNLTWTALGGGTVTSVSVVTANGASGTVANPTTTPALTLSPTSSVPAASSFASYDANVNLSANAIIPGFATTVTAAGTTTLVVGSAQFQDFTGTTTQIVKLPVTSTLTLGQYFVIKNDSTGTVTVESSGGNTIVILQPGTKQDFVCVLLTGTTAASWSNNSPYWTLNSNGLYENEYLMAIGVTNPNGATLALGPLGTPSLYFSGNSTANKIMMNGPGPNDMGMNTYQSGSNSVLGIGYAGSPSTAITDSLSIFDNGNILVAGKAITPAIQVTTSPTSGYLLTSDASGNGTWQAPATAGTVTSVGLSVPGTSIFGTSGTNPVTSSGTIGLTTTGTSGGIPYFSSTSQLASSALLTASQLVLGGGAGSAPASLAAGSQYQSLVMGASNPGYGAVNLAQSAATTGVLPKASVGLGYTFNAQSGTTYTFVLGDGVNAGGNTIVQSTSSSATTFTIPTNASVAYAVGDSIQLQQLGSGTLTIAAAGGVTLESASTGLAILAQYDTAVLIKQATNTWTLSGSLGP